MKYKSEKKTKKNYTVSECKLPSAFWHLETLKSGFCFWFKDDDTYVYLIQNYRIENIIFKKFSNMPKGNNVVF